MTIINEHKTLCNDPFYQNAVKNGYNPYDLGYFDSEWSEYPDVNLIDESDKVVLYTTGGFAPFHAGHHNMMQKAISHFTSMGKEIVACIVVVDSQDYANTKPYMISYDERVKSVPSEYTVCDFERDKSPINFTYYAFKFQNGYPNCQIVYVCGSDNQNFAPLYQDFGTIAIVERNTPLKSYNGNVITIPNQTHTLVNSTQIRKQQHER